MRVLIVEDEPRMADVICRSLRKEGIAADAAGNGDDAVWMAGAVAYDAIVLDVMLPGRDGFEVCRALRARDVWSPVLMLTARERVEDRVAGLDSGADDYLVKPFATAELLARLRSLVRRGAPRRPVPLVVGSIRLDAAARRVERDGTEIPLAPKEFAVLETLMRHAGEVVTRDRLLEASWDFAYEARSNVVDVHIRRLRDKLETASAPSPIETIRGVGYRLRVDEP